MKLRTTKIEWATDTANYLAGCNKVSPECEHCYALRDSIRFAANPNAPARYKAGIVEGDSWTGKVAYDPEALKKMFHRLRSARRDTRIFINSMSDTFHANAPAESLIDLAEGIRAFESWRAHGQTDVNARSERTLMLLTKRPKALLAWQRKHFPKGLPGWVVVGTTGGTQATIDGRMAYLSQVAAWNTFLSVEPLLEEVTLSRWLQPLAPFLDLDALPETWSAFPWPEWVPPAWREHVERFWSAFYGRSPKQWLQDVRGQGSPPVGAEVTCSVLSGDRRQRLTGRWLHTWNNMGALVTPDGVAHVTSNGQCLPGTMTELDADYPRFRQSPTWVIVGGESGHGARPMHPEWVRKLRREAHAAGAAFLFKQWGDWLPKSQLHPSIVRANARRWGTLALDGTWSESTTPWNGRDDVAAPDGMHEAVMLRVGKRVAGRHLDGRTYTAGPRDRYYWPDQVL